MIIFIVFRALKTDKMVINTILATAMFGIYIVYCGHKEKLLDIFTGYGSENKKHFKA
jgi:branched-subunit amino acid transport protein AzlD